MCVGGQRHPLDKHGNKGVDLPKLCNFDSQQDIFLSPVPGFSKKISDSFLFQNSLKLLKRNEGFIWFYSHAWA